MLYFQWNAAVALLWQLLYDKGDCVLCCSGSSWLAIMIADVLDWWIRKYCLKFKLSFSLKYEKLAHFFKLNLVRHLNSCLKYHFYLTTQECRMDVSCTVLSCSFHFVSGYFVTNLPLMHCAIRKVLSELMLHHCLIVTHYSTSVRLKNITKPLTECSGKQLFTSEALTMI